MLVAVCVVRLAPVEVADVDSFGVVVVMEVVAAVVVMEVVAVVVVLELVVRVSVVEISLGAVVV